MKQNKYDKHCAKCFAELFPDDPRSKTVCLPFKELRVKKYLDEKYTDMFKYNKLLSINRRIDFRFEIGEYIFCIEVDENQHKYYDPIDEKKRIQEIHKHFEKNLIFIRFNPDNYTKSGKSQKTPMIERLEELKIKIDSIIDFIESGNHYEQWYTEFKMFFDDVIKEVKKRSKNLCLSTKTQKGKPCRNP
uniref:Endonuclease n=1 Tax=Pithovirus LCPAC401 TaxID=2506595 RepID=A0A481ZDK1_9VIRU|nr:MAG: endonuclease [Pithovirus LCPAC401]